MERDDQWTADVAYVFETQMQDAKYQPPMKLTEAKALVLAGQVVAQPDGSYAIRGSQDEPYRWTPGVGCDCPQAKKKQAFCKHATAVEALQKVRQYRGARQPGLPLPPQTADERLAQSQVPGRPAADFPPTLISDPETEAASGALAAAPVHLPTASLPPPAGDHSTPHPACGALHLLRSLQVSQVIGALLQAQAAIKNPKFDTQNPHFKTRYASLAQVRDTLTPALTAAGLVVTQFLSTVEGAVCCETILWHPSGEYLGSSLRLPAGKTDAQGYGAASTYARRYGLMSLCNVVGDEDDDAESLRKGGGGSAGNTSPPATPVEDTDVQKRTLLGLLRRFGLPQGSRKEVIEAEVQRRTGLRLEAASYGEIIRRLEYEVPLSKEGA